MSIDFRSAGHSGDESNHYYRQSTAPTTGDPLQVGDLWSDTTANLLKRCTSIAPVTFVSVEGGSAAHNLFSSTHGDVDETDTPTDGQILKYNSAAAKWRAENEAAGSGESNTASNVNVGGIGVFKQKTGVDLEFRGIIADSTKISVTLDAPNNEVGLDVVEANLTLSNIGGSVTDGQIPAAIARDSELHAQAHAVDGADHTASGLTAGHIMRATGATAFAFGALQDGDIPAAIARDSELHGQAHAVDGVDHSASGLTAGHIMRAIGATTFAFGALQDGDIPAAIARDTELHAQAHVLDGADHTISGKTDGQVLKATGATTFAFEDDQVVINFIIDGGGSAITTGVKGFVKMPFAVTVTGWNILADQTGSIVVDVWAEDEALSPPTVADTIAGTEKPTLATAQKNEDLALTTWTNIAAGDWVGFNVDSIATVQRVTVAIRGKKT